MRALRTPLLPVMALLIATAWLSLGLWATSPYGRYLDHGSWSERRGRRPSWHALRLGAHHGAFCVGCCWAIMLLMFVVGAGNVGWMLALGAIMAVEKSMPWGRRLSHPLGVALVAWGALVVVTNAE